MKKYIIYTLSILLFFSCSKDEDTLWEVDLLGPVIKSSLSMQNILPDSMSKINSDNSVDIDYIFPFSPIQNQFFLEIPDTSVTKTFPIPFASSTSLPAGFQFVSNSSENTLDLGDARLEVMKIKTGKVHYKIISQINEKTIFNYQILSSDDGNGNSYNKNINVPAGTVASPSVVEGDLILDGYTFGLRTVLGNKYNTFETKIGITVNPSGSAVNVSNTDSVFIENKILDINPEYVKGYIGKTELTEGPITQDFAVINKIIDGSIDLDEVDISTVIKNYVGAEAQLKLAQFSSINTRVPNTVNLYGNYSNNWINLNRATESYGVITPSEYTISYNKLNSNITQFLENLPNKYSSKMDLKINPLGNVSAGGDFIYFNKIIEADFHLKIPLKFIANNLTLQDTLDLGINKDDNNINFGNSMIYAKNSFPFDAEFQIYLLDENNWITDSIAVNGLLASAVIDANNKVVSPVNSTLKFSIPADKMEILENNSKVILKVKFNTNSTTHTTIYKEHKVDLQIVVDLNMDINY